MKTNLLKSVVLVASLLGALSSASAETLHVRIPFGFSAGGTAMPAGAYSIRPIPDTPSVLLFENEGTKLQVMVFARSGIDAPAQSEEKLTFTASTSERMALTNIATDGWTYELSMQSTRRPLKGAALALTGK